MSSVEAVEAWCPIVVDGVARKLLCDIPNTRADWMKIVYFNGEDCCSNGDICFVRECGLLDNKITLEVNNKR